jgi:hypothetical protein
MDGYDPKGALWKDSLTHRDPTMVGMHTYDDAMLYVGGRALAAGNPRILDVMPTILGLMGLPAPAGLDGSSLLV